MPPPPQTGTMIVLSSDGTSTLNGQSAEIDFYLDNGMTFVNIEDISKCLEYDYIAPGEDDDMRINQPNQLVILRLNSNEYTMQDTQTKKKNTGELLRAPFMKNGNVYVYVKDLPNFTTNLTVNYNSATKSIIISDNSMGPGGGPGGPGVPMGPGAMQQPQGNQPVPSMPGQADNNVTAVNEENAIEDSDRNEDVDVYGRGPGAYIGATHY